MRNSLAAEIAREVVATSNMKPKAVFVQLTCSPKPHTSVQKGDKGHEHWRRDVFHVQRSGMSTLCGQDCSEWLRIGSEDAAAALEDGNCCSRCAAQLRKQV